MLVSKKLVALIPVTLLSLQPAGASSEIGLTPVHAHAGRSVEDKNASTLKSVYQQAKDYGFSDQLLGELKKIFPDAMVGAEIKEDASMVKFEADNARKPPTRTIRTVQTRQVASAVTDEEGTGVRRKVTHVPTISAAMKDGALAEPPAKLFAEENKELEERLSKEFTAKLHTKGYDIQALNVRMESLTTVKTIVLATTKELAESSARDKLMEMRNVVENEVLSTYPNMKLTKGSSFGLATASGAKLTETSALLYELDRPDFKPSVREKTVSVPSATAKDEKSDKAAPPAPAKSRRRVRKVNAAPADESVKEPSAVSLQDKEKAEKARETPPVASPAASPAATPKPVSTEVKEKTRLETITPSESDFQD